MKITYTPQDGCIRGGGKIIGRVYQHAETRKWQARINGTTGDWMPDGHAAFADAFAKKEGYANLEERNAAVRVHNSRVRESRKVMRQWARNVVEGMHSTDKATRDAAMDELFNKLK